VKGLRIVTEGPGARFDDRILHPAHFEFRGGSPRWGTWAGMRTRHVDRHAHNHQGSGYAGQHRSATA
jgi:hypothetical protein